MTTHRLAVCLLIAVLWPSHLAAEDLSRIQIPDNLKVVWQRIHSQWSEGGRGSEWGEATRDFLGVDASNPMALILPGKGGILVAGGSHTGVDHPGAQWMVRTDDVGHVRWEWHASLRGRPTQGNFGVLFEEADGSFVAVNTLPDSGQWLRSDQPLKAVKFSPVGDLLGTESLSVQPGYIGNPTTNGYRRRVEVLPDGQSFITDFTWPRCRAADLDLSIRSIPGERLWAGALHRQDGEVLSVGRGVLMPDGGVAVIVSRERCDERGFGDGQRSHYLARFDAAGSLSWLREIPKPPRRTAIRQVNVSDNGRIAVLGVHDIAGPDGAHGLAVHFFDEQGNKTNTHPVLLPIRHKLFDMRFLPSGDVLLFGGDERKSAWIGLVHPERGFHWHAEIVGLRQINVAVADGDGSILLAGEVVPIRRWVERKTGRGKIYRDQESIAHDLWLAKVRLP